ncbi:MAG: carboxymuconolactone decarboxylase family protein [Pyrinomonadaceae bacterium]|nr:carboxymuconolactone decarboxylase family protein [Sphingobacteriaceae bacterium]
MSKIKTVTQETTSDAAKSTMEMVKGKLGRVPNMYQVMANSPAVLEAYVKFNGALSGGTLGSKMAELIALATAEENTCSYCLSAHSFLGAKVGLSEQQILSGRAFESEDPKIKAGLLFTKKMLVSPKGISSADIDPLRNAGYSDGDILEIVANVIRNIFTNYINIISETEVDWPVIVKPLNTVCN